MVEHSIVGERIFLKSQFGTVRYRGKLLNNPKAGESIWLGVEWDEETAGRHNGTVDGTTYFVPEFLPVDSHCCSFLREGKITVGGVELGEALKLKYNPEEDMSEKEKEEARQMEL